jgi:hypothetical protein
MNLNSFVLLYVELLIVESLIIINAKFVRIRFFVRNN